MGPRLLALDTSTEVLAVALADGAREWFATEAGGARASSRLVPCVLELLARAGLAPAALDAIGFGAGPGAFTGLRSACAVAQGFAFGLQRPVLPVDSLMVVAEDARAQLGERADALWVAMDARMDEVYAARYEWAAERWQPRDAPALWTLDALARRWADAPPLCVAGSAINAFGDRLPLGQALRVAIERDRARALLAVARRQWQLGAAVPATQALPIYLRDKVALTSAERAAAAASRPAPSR
ncbi:MAG: tRNA (adenosine(37)-N6)-threonylcarbamoyltransferase complex dimerization subunit type 1 TsaB [Burkholderiaceae bacterium]